MLITFAKSLDLDHDQQSVSSDLDLTTVDTLVVFLKEANFGK